MTKSETPINIKLFWKIYIAHFLLLGIFIFYLLLHKELIREVFSYLLLVALEFIYLTTTYGYLKSGKKSTYAFFYGGVQALIMVPLLMSIFPESCGKCYFSREEGDTTIFIYVALFLMVIISITFYLKLIGVLPSKKWKAIFYFLPPLILATIWLSSSGTGRLFGYFLQ